MPLLHEGDMFPPLELTLANGDRSVIPESLQGRYAVVLFSRAAGCRACVEQLRAFQRGSARLTLAGIDIVALTADPIDAVAALTATQGLAYPVGYGADPTHIAEVTGAFITLDPPQLQTTGFVLDPRGAVVISVYSCGALGQLVPDDVLDLVRDIRAEEGSRHAEVPSAHGAG